MSRNMLEKVGRGGGDGKLVKKKFKVLKKGQNHPSLNFGIAFHPQPLSSAAEKTHRGSATSWKHNGNCQIAVVYFQGRYFTAVYNICRIPRNLRKLSNNYMEILRANSAVEFRG